MYWINTQNIHDNDICAQKYQNCMPSDADSECRELQK